MDQAPSPAVRTVALLGASGSGKTTLTEALLHRAGTIPRAGRVEDGTTVSDHEPEEIARGISLALGVAPFRWQTDDGRTYDVTLLDTPGYLDFAGAVDAALSAADLAVIVVSAVDGVQAGTHLAWRAAGEAGVPRLVVVTKEDRARADFHRVLAQLRDAFGDVLVPLELPFGDEAGFTGVADVLSEGGYVYDADGRHHDGPLPSGVAEEEHRLHESVTEDIVAHDDDQLERYLAGDVPSVADLEHTLAQEVCDGLAVPVLVASGTTGVGVDRLADLVCELCPGPGARPATVLAGDVEVQVAPDPRGPTLVHAFRTVADPFVGQVTVLRVLSGTLRPGDRLVNTTTRTEERVPGLFRLRGKEHTPLDVAVAGQVAAVAKLTGTPTGSLLAAKGTPGVGMTARPARERPGVYALALDPVTQSDDDRLSAALGRLVAEDPTLTVDRTGERTVLRGLGDTHLAVALERLARVFGVHVTTSPVPVGYRETIAKPVEAEGKVKKQSGGHGQYAVVQLRVSPLPPGSGFEFVDSVVGGAIPRSYLPAVERGVREAMAAGGPHGFPVVDVRVEVYDGKAHSVDSSDMAFRTAAAVGLKEALAAAGTVVLEPVCRVQITVPTSAQGDVMSDLSARRGRITDTVSLDGGEVVVEATVPEAELQRYVLDLRSLTGGRGSLVVAHDHYAPCPEHLTPA
ncbi:elongation factor G [Cellulomonas wangsupingiae]|uniref:Elongation factor G n=1 Tax=Cellulomonas wangsupingiae TaxID=2968085 RepID=A0ABY5K307_9CELL|nr:elongation factor G [Cellulomonas wangsupingiae]MCC2336113.1 elongation factor G [Cellulomonas wangsupingiae]UUI64834.1 elongation factor G [Cellulomonas wangsupingiae]